MKPSRDEIRPKDIIGAGHRFAREIKELHECFYEIQRRSTKKDPGIYFKFARVELNIMNNDASYQELMGQMKGIVEMRKIEEMRSARSFDQIDEEVAFMMVSGSL